MCFRIHSEHFDEKIAKKNITCYKIFDVCDKDKCYRSPYQRTLYKLGETKVRKHFSGIKDLAIERGLHSYSTFSEAESKVNGGYADVVIKCVIPKGTKYYYNPEDEEYVSLAIKVIKEIKQGK